MLFDTISTHLINLMGISKQLEVTWVYNRGKVSFTLNQGTPKGLD